MALLHTRNGVNWGGDNNLPYRYLLPFASCGVDLFILISGYFLINLKPKVVIRLAVIIIFFELFSYIIANIVSIDARGALQAKNIIDPLGSSHYWFITYYIALVLLSPVLNKSLEITDIISLRRIIILLSVFNAVSCWLFSNRLDQCGYSLFNFIYLYCIGHYIQREDLATKLTKTKISLLFAIAITINLTIVTLLIKKNSDVTFESLAFSQAGKYSNPFTIACAISALMMFLKFDFKSKVINNLASCSLGVYLLQDGILGQYIYKYQIEISSKDNVMYYLLLCAVLFVGFWLSSYLLMGFINKICDFTNKYSSIAAHKFKCLQTK